MTGRIFISYRRGDRQAAAGRLYDRLLQHFDRDQLFMDVEAIEPGVDFVKSLDDQLASCSAFIAVIGPDWTDARDGAGDRRLENPADFVRLEIEAALKRDIRVIPVLVDGASMPRPIDLPASMQPLAYRNAVEFAHHRFAADCDDLARGLKRALGIEVALAPQGLLSPTPEPVQVGRKLTWPEIFFSFRGRIARREFLLAYIVVLATALALAGGLMYSVNAVFGDNQSDDLKQKLDAFFTDYTTILEAFTWWPTWALILKRLHDLGQGFVALLPFIALSILGAVLDLKGMDDASTNVLVFTMGITFMLAVVKGTTGPNKYGPDPLAKLTPTKPAAAAE